MLYKYLNPSRIDVLQNLKVRFTQPCELNDPYESALLVQANLFPAWEVDMLKFAEELEPEDDEEIAMVEKVIAEMREKAQQMMSPVAMGQRLADLINKAQGVLSLSRTNDSLLMWAHYSNSHMGYVLGLDESHEWFRATDKAGKATKPHNVIYTSRRSAVEAGSEDFYERLLCYKSLEWAYEEEVRIFRSFGSTQEQFDQNTVDQKHLFNVPKDCIKEIFIGANATAELREQILAAVRLHRLDVEIFEAYIDHERYALKFRPVDYERPPPDYSQNESVNHYHPDMHMVLNVKPS